jgi:adenylate cyclase
MLKKDKLFETIGELLEKNTDFEIIKKEVQKLYGIRCAALVLDSTGFTRITKKHGTTFFLTLIYKLRILSSEIFKNNGAIEWRSGADNMFAQFNSVDEAVKSALLIHKYFVDNPMILTESSDTFGCCIGIGWGDLLKSEHEGVYGEDMNYAAKLGEDIAEKGETLITQAAYDELNNKDNYEIEKRQMRISGVDLPYFNITLKG